jgi:hypothetical protein
MSVEDFIGAWKLISVELRRGNDVDYPYGREPVACARCVCSTLS